MSYVPIPPFRVKTEGHTGKPDCCAFCLQFCKRFQNYKEPPPKPPVADSLPFRPEPVDYSEAPPPPEVKIVRVPRKFENEQQGV